MFRRSLLAASSSALLVALSPAAFSAAVLHTGDLVSSRAGAAGKMISKRDVERLLAMARMDIAVAPLSLAIRPAGGHVTLTGIAVGAPNAEAAARDTLADTSEAGGKAIAVAASNLGAAPAPAPTVPERIGAASSFGVVPEPSSIALVAMGAVALLRRRRG